MADYRRYFVPGGTYFFTVVTRNRAPVFAEESAWRLLGNLMQDCQQQWPFEINAIVLCLNIFTRFSKWNGQEVASLFRRISLAMIKRNKSFKSSLRGKRFMAGWNSDLLEDIFAGK